MNFKTFSAIFALFLAIQTTSQSPAPVQADGIKDIIVTVLNTVLDTVKYALIGFNAEVDDFEKDVDSTDTAIAADLAIVAKYLNSELLAAIDLLRANATEDGVLVLDCIEAQKTATEEVIDTFSSLIATFAISETNLILSEVRNIVNDTIQLAEALQTPVTNLSSCSDEDQACFTVFLAEEAAVLETIPNSIDEEKAKLIELGHKLADVVSNFVTEWEDDITGSAQQIFNSAVECFRA